MIIYEIWRLETTVNFGVEFVPYGMFSTREKAEAEIRLLNEAKIPCLDESPQPFKIKEHELDKSLQHLNDL